MQNKKVLIISHNPINDFDNMGKTMGNLFSQFPQESLCQLFFKKQNIKSNNCNSFYNIDDVSVLKSIFNRRINTGREILQKEYNFEKAKEIEEDVFQYGRKRTGYIYIARNIIWKLGKWYTKQLEEWINKNKPSCIFLFAGDYTFSLDITMKLSKKAGIPFYLYFSDEYYRYVRKSHLIDKIYKFFYRKKMRKIIKMSKGYFCITEDMTEYYEKIFNKKGCTIMNTTKITPLPIKKDEEKLVISYIGNLGYNRWKNIIDIADIINIVNEENKKKIEFYVYSGEKNKEVVKKLKENDTLNYMGYVEPNEVPNIMIKTDILIHTESFEQIDIDKIKYSISTKIPDSLASGRILLVYAPKDIACTKYIEKNNVGIVAHNQKELEECLTELLNNKIDTNSIINNAIKLVEERHRDNYAYREIKKIGETDEE